jgi:hypothetical protein
MLARRHRTLSALTILAALISACSDPDTNADGTPSRARTVEYIAEISRDHGGVGFVIGYTPINTSTKLFEQGNALCIHEKTAGYGVEFHCTRPVNIDASGVSVSPMDDGKYGDFWEILVPCKQESGECLKGSPARAETSFWLSGATAAEQLAKAIQHLVALDEASHESPDIASDKALF